MRLSSRLATIVACGARTAVGLDSETTAAAVRAGVSRIGEHPRFRDRQGEPFMVGMVPGVEALDPVGRMIALATAAVTEATARVPLLVGNPVPVYVGVRDRRFGFSTDHARALELALAALLQRFCVPRISIVPGGNAAGLHALGIAKNEVEGGRARFAIAIGVDSHLGPTSLEQLDKQGRCKSLANTHGFSPGEAAAALVVTQQRTATSARLEVLARVDGYGAAVEQAVTTGQPCTGVGLTSAVCEALRYLPERRPIDAQYCDLNGEFERTDEFMYLTQRLPPGVLRSVDKYTTPASSCGDVGAASGPLMAILAIEAARRGYHAGPLALVWAASDSGQRAACVLNCDVETEAAGR